MRLAAYFSFCLALGCAGPMTPFGGVDVLGAIGAASSGGSATQANGTPETGPNVRFFPRRQALHGAAPFSVIVNDRDGIPEDHRIALFYNGMDITDKFMARAERTFDSPERRQMRLTTRRPMRLPPTRDNRIKAHYWRTPHSEPVVSWLQPPECPLSPDGSLVTRTPGFSAPWAIVEMINSHALRNKLNPHYLAGLIAQESAFNPRAVSTAKALGLTQVTSLGAGEIIKRNPGWPQYPGLNEMPLPILKIAIASEEIHAGNEWRLDPRLSIEGGAEYLSYLLEYWNRADKRDLVNGRLGDKTATLAEVVLASYNSGPWRVSQAIERNGTAWLLDEELGEAHKYVRKVTSYCDYFAQAEEF